MPNWVDNDLTIQGQSDKISEFVNGLEKDFVEVWHPSVKEGEDMLKVEVVKIAESYYPQPKELSFVNEGRNQDGAEYWWETYDNEYVQPKSIEDLFKNLTDKFEGGKVEQKAVKITEMIEMIFKYGAFSWYDWRLKNWGTKSSDIETRLKQVDDETVMCNFRTAWNPPVPLLVYLSKKFELDITNRWDEESGYYGTTRIVNGIIQNDKVAIRDIYNEEYIINNEEE